MPVREQRRFPASFPILYLDMHPRNPQHHRDLSSLVSGTDSIPASPTMDHNMSDAALSSPDDSLHGVAGNQDQ